MLTVRKVRVGIGDLAGSIAAAEYSLDAPDTPRAFARDEDAADRADAMWLGTDEALAELGLERGAEPTVDELAAALRGQHVETGEEKRSPGYVKAVHPDGQPRLDPDGEEYHEAVVNSFDLTFSAPKSVSVVWFQANGELRDAIDHAMLAASNAAVAHLTSTRLVVGGEQVAHGFAASASLHVTARAAEGEALPGPQLHVHTHLVGVLDDEGDLRTPKSSALYKDSAMREGGAVARAVLAQRLREIGFGIRWGTGRNGRYFEIEGVPEELCERESARSRDVARWVGEQSARVGGELSMVQQAKGALLTRTAKFDASPERIQAERDAIAREHGVDGAAIERWVAEPKVQLDVDVLRKQLHTELLKRMWKEGPTVSLHVVRSMAFELAPMGLSFGEISTMLDRMAEAGELIVVDRWRLVSGEQVSEEEREKGDRWHVTTSAIRERETYVQRVAAERGQPVETAALTEAAFQRGIEVAELGLNGFKLDKDQADAVRTLTGGAGWACLTGRAGTGKGPVIEAVAEAHRSDGWQVLACAVDGATEERVGHQVGAQGLTIQQLLYREYTGWIEVDEGTVVLIDEASKVGLEDWYQLARLVERTRMRLIAVGDVGQSGAIECAGMLDVMLKDERVPGETLTEVRRHRDFETGDVHRWLGDYQLELYEGRAAEAIRILRENEAITMHATRKDAMRKLVEKWEQRRIDHKLDVRDTILIVYGSNDDIDRVNMLAQQRRLDAGEIGGDGVQGDRGYLLYEGDVVMLRERAYEPAAKFGETVPPPRVENGTCGVVVAVDAASERVVVAFDQPSGGSREVVVDLGELRRARERAGAEEKVPALRLMYAGHPFPMQGETFGYVGSLWGHPSQTKEDTYSGDTRAKYFLDIHLDRESAGWEGTDDDRYRRWGKKLSEARHRIASVMYETTRMAIGREPAPVEDVGRLRRPAHAYADERERVERLREQRAAAMRGEVVVPEPLGDQRTRLGADRVAQIARRARDWAAPVAELDVEQLLDAHESGRHALRQLDGAAALWTHRLERDVARLEARLAGSADAAAADFDRKLLEERRDHLQELRDEGRHPQQWLRRYGDTVARAVAAERELTRRHLQQTSQRVREPDAADRASGEPEVSRAPGIG